MRCPGICPVRREGLDGFGTCRGHGLPSVCVAPHCRPLHVAACGYRTGGRNRLQPVCPATERPDRVAISRTDVRHTRFLSFQVLQTFASGRAGVYPSSARGTPRDCRGASTYWLGPSRAPSRLNHPSRLAIPHLSPYGSFCTLRPHPAASVHLPDPCADSEKSMVHSTAPLRLVRRRSARCGPYHRTMTR